MEAIIKRTGNSVEIALNGRLDTIASSDFEAQVTPFIGIDGLNIILDCNNLQYVSSSGLRIFLTLQKSVAAHSGSLLIKSLSSDIREIFDMTGFSKIFTIE